ncbi:amidohydrolase family protein [Paraflavitalea sp. CAU 1676]|uniref:amidohydrolase family protein n=1 Tax=Paraflavitalea sp. CAU 1676 TaxID=3032598 RepID=UPI0023DBD591|nr:amidohydrolase family protein [Paraflavitalea sp. CAU 1676]MDF2189422.1 amidohydrolase family protein [Paraflavitalea sp. CAU 1676]
MKRIFFTILMSSWVVARVAAQETVYPAPAQTQTIALTNATVHVGNGQVIENGMVVFSKGKIIDVKPTAVVADAKVIDCKGKHIYPGLILSTSNVGLVEVGSVRATSDASELGDMNTNIRSLVAYNTDSKVTNTLRNNGILLANIVPQGGVLSGSSSVVQLDAWNWEDATYLADNGIHFNVPSLLLRGGGRGGFGRFGGQQPAGDPIKRALEQIESVKVFFREAKAYCQEASHEETNTRCEAVKGLFTKKQKLYVHCDIVKEMLIAIDFAKEFGFDVVIVGGSESYQIADLLKANNIAVILQQMHSLPTMVDDDVDQPYKTPAALQKAGVLFSINDDDGNTRQRNLAFNAGTAAAYGLTKEEALAAVSLNAAKILGVSDKTGSLESGKDANLLVCDGDLLDMRSNVILNAFIQGREINLTDKHKQLYERYKYKYGLK